MSIYLRNVLRFIILVLIQTLLLNEIPLRWWSNPGGLPPYTPFIYPLFILLLPMSTPVWFLLISGFVMGLTIDTFMDTGGIHAAACVLMAFFRTKILSALLPSRLVDYPNLSPGIKPLGWTPFLTYAFTLLFIHHFAYYAIEIWSFQNLSYLLLKLLSSLITSMIFVILYSLLFPSSLNAYND